jgi:hypothetical protein
MQLTHDFHPHFRHATLPVCVVSYLPSTPCGV